MIFRVGLCGCPNKVIFGLLFLSIIYQKRFTLVGARLLNLDKEKTSIFILWAPLVLSSEELELLTIVCWPTVASVWRETILLTGREFLGCTLKTLSLRRFYLVGIYILFSIIVYTPLYTIIVMQPVRFPPQQWIETRLPLWKPHLAHRTIVSYPSPSHFL